LVTGVWVHIAVSFNLAASRLTYYYEGTPYVINGVTGFTLLTNDRFGVVKITF
jgi:hypothetical protein